jgi:quinol monooxygenase YgiN
MSDTIIVTGYLKVDPARHDEAVAAALEVMQATRAEEGNEGYTFSADLETPGVFHITEQWASHAALDAHMAAPHMATFLTAVSGLGVAGGGATKWEGATPSKLM